MGGGRSASPPDASLTTMMVVFVFEPVLVIVVAVAVDGGAGAGGGGVGAVRGGKLKEFPVDQVRQKRRFEAI